MELQILIIGGGFGGLRAAQTLGHSQKLKVCLLDRKNHHLFQPLLYQVATATLNPSDIGTPIRQILATQTNTQVLMENVLSADLTAKTVTTDSAVHPFDYLILACGSTHSYFGKSQWEEFAPGLKTIEQALEIRRRILMAFEMAEKEKDPARQAMLLTFVIIGGGPTGVELAGAVAELSNAIVSKEFRNIKPESTRIILIDGGQRLITAFASTLSENAKTVLESKGVTIIQGQHAEEITAKGVQLKDRFIESTTIMWAAGVKPSALSQTLGVPLDKSGRVMVQSDLSVPGFPFVFVVGDQAYFETPNGSLPGLAPVAMQQGIFAAKNILRELDGKPRKPFQYINKGTMAVIGRSNAVVELPGVGKLTGFIGWMIWIFVHIMYLVGYRNRLNVLLNWAWSYLTFKSGARLITQRMWKENESVPPSAKMN